MESDFEESALMEPRAGHAGGDEGRSIVVGYDGSPTADKAVRWAARRAGPGGNVCVVHCYGRSPDWLGADPRPLLEDPQLHGQAVLDALALESGDTLDGVEYETELVGGDPAQAVLDSARRRDADEIVVGSRGHGRVRSALGSVSHGVIEHADRPVVVIPAT